MPSLSESREWNPAIFETQQRGKRLHRKQHRGPGVWQQLLNWAAGIPSPQHPVWHPSVITGLHCYTDPTHTREYPIVMENNQKPSRVDWVLVEKGFYSQGSGQGNNKAPSAEPMVRNSSWWHQILQMHSCDIQKTNNSFPAIQICN